MWPMDSKNRTRNNQDPKNKAIEAHLGLLKERIAKLIREKVESILNTLTDTFLEVQEREFTTLICIPGSFDIIGVNCKY